MTPLAHRIIRALAAGLTLTAIIAAVTIAATPSLHPRRRQPTDASDHDPVATVYWPG